MSLVDVLPHDPVMPTTLRAMTTTVLGAIEQRLAVSSTITRNGSRQTAGAARTRHVAQARLDRTHDRRPARPHPAPGPGRGSRWPSWLSPRSATNTRRCSPVRESVLTPLPVGIRALHDLAAGSLGHGTGGPNHPPRAGRTRDHPRAAIAPCAAEAEPAAASDDDALFRHGSHRCNHPASLAANARPASRSSNGTTLSRRSGRSRAPCPAINTVSPGLAWRHRETDRLGAIDDLEQVARELARFARVRVHGVGLPAVLQTVHHVEDDLRGILTARVVAGQVRVARMTRHGLRHRRPLRAIAIATAAEPRRAGPLRRHSRSVRAAPSRARPACGRSRRTCARAHRA